MKDDLDDLTHAHTDVVRIERLTHHIARIHDGLNEVRRGQDDLRASMKELADALTRLTLVEERQSSTSSAIERLAGSVEKLDGRLHNLEVAQPMQAKAAEWVQSALWAAAAAAVIFVAGKAGLF